MTLLERWDESHTEAMQWAPEEIRRALAIAQAVDEWNDDAIAKPREWRQLLELVIERADELLEGK